MKHQHPTDLKLRIVHNDELKKYKQLCNTKKNQYEQDQIERMSELALDPNEFWRSNLMITLEAI